MLDPYSTLGGGCEMESGELVCTASNSVCFLWRGNKELDRKKKLWIDGMVGDVANSQILSLITTAENPITLYAVVDFFLFKTITKSVLHAFDNRIVFLLTILTNWYVICCNVLFVL